VREAYGTGYALFLLWLEYVSSNVQMFHLMCSLLQEDSVKTGKVTAAGMYFLGFPVYRFEQNNLVSLQDWLGFVV